MKNEGKSAKYRRYGLILYYLLKILKKTLKIKIITNEKVKINEKNYIFAFWHNKLLGSTLCLDNIEKRAVLASPTKDGELIAVSLEKLGFHMIRGSSDKNSISSVISLLKLIKEGYSIGTPVDGPKGPRYEVKQGLIYIAKKGKRQIVPTGTAYEKKWIFKKAWDKFEFPKPFSKVVYLYGNPIEISEDVSIEEYCEKIGAELKRLDKKAETYF